MPFCYAPWTNIDIDPAGKITPCCKFQKQYYDRTYNIQQDSITDYLESPLLAAVKEDFNNDQWPVGCERCRIEEQNGIASKRNLDWDRWQTEYEQQDLNHPNFITASIAFGNTCNLKCITCNSYNSSRWHEEYKKVYRVDWPHVQYYRSDFVDKFVELAPELIHLDIPGGEPFLSGIREQLQLLQHYVDSDKAKDIVLHYTTNATVFPDQRWWQLWQHFKEIDIQLSIDGVGDRYEYIRYPGQWTTLTDHVDQYLKQQQQHSNLRLSVSHTVSAYNIYYLDEFFDWCLAVGLPTPWLGRVHRPEHLRPSVWPNSAKTDIYNKLISSQHPGSHAWANLVRDTDDSEQFEKFCQLTTAHDQHRGLDFAKTFPEMATYFR
jgi:MoaA/NifB/PqqE/SkfB family radical SAM enzyme